MRRISQSSRGLPGKGTALSFRTIVSSLMVLCLAMVTGALLSCQKSGQNERAVSVAIALLPSERPAYVEVLKTFTERTGIKVRLVAQQYQEIRDAVEAEARAGSGQLDLVELDVYLLPLYAHYMLPVDTLLSGEDSIRASISPAIWNTGVIGDSVVNTLFVPHRLNWEAMIYNADSIAEPPRDWDQLLAFAERHPGAVGIKGAQYEGLVCDAFPILWQAGGDPLRPTDPATLRALKFLKRLAPYLNGLSRSYKENTILQALEHREILICFNWPFVVPLLQGQEMLPRHFRTAPLPAGPARSATVLGGGYIGIPRTAPHPKAAARLMEYLLSADAQQEFSRLLGWFPVRSDAWGSLTPEDREAYAGFLAMRPHVVARPGVADYEAVSQAWQRGFSRLLFEGADPENVAHEIASALSGITGRTDR